MHFFVTTAGLLGDILVLRIAAQNPRAQGEYKSSGELLIVLADESLDLEEMSCVLQVLEVNDVE